jgi:TusA-related sulfurtransferase
MKTTKKLDLTDTVSFLGLLKCQKELAQIGTGDRLEVVMDDPGMVNDLIKIIERSNDRVTEQSQDGDCIKICIAKGNSKGGRNNP